MRFKSAFKYYLNGIPKSLIIYYGIIYVLLLWLGITFLVAKRASIHWSTGGYEMGSIIFIFVVGLNSFKSNFRMLLANGVSRTTMFKSYTTSVLPLAGVMAFIDSLNGVIFSSFTNYQTMYAQMYHLRYAGLPDTFGTTMQIAAEGFLWMFFTYIMVAMVGYLITTLYYRMNRPLKLTVSIGVPVLLFVVLPYFNTILFHGWLFRAISSAISAFWGFANKGAIPYVAMLSCAVTFALAGLFSFLAMRRAQIKD
jgi:hypothetical protein